jgi:hypothetical protein
MKPGIAVLAKVSINLTDRLTELFLIAAVMSWESTIEDEF